ncbi:hypothetical protein BG015_000688 [Linnemannia schmuckeri]|uniref:Uncharacterized protein n=1 Tax=Linnemannia schmuckeri TaxID=64567 RepID=A0A9P5VDP0_9FUNG|nr:hypothetical protein BG015_000688 [Linnemannia schmuckeri]
MSQYPNRCPADRDGSTLEAQDAARCSRFLADDGGGGDGVEDLEKLSTRGRHLPYTSYEAFANGDAKEKDGLFNFLFQDQAEWMIGVPEYLQRALLNRPGADRIVALRIPIRRVRSFQERWDRAPREWDKARSRRGKARAAREKLQAEREMDEEIRGRNLDVVASSSLLATSSSSPQENKDNGTQTASDYTMNVSSRPYCFTLNKLTNLRRIEICNLSQNSCDWETLHRALFTLEFGSNSDVQLEDLSKIKPTAALQKKRRHRNKIRELCLTTQSTMGPEIDRILECFGGLEVLEIMTPSFQYHPWVTNWDPSLCRELKVLRNLSLDVLTTVTEAFGDQLEELVICFSGHEGPLQFKHPLTHLTRLAIRFTSLKRFYFEGLAQQCPLLEWIVIQYTWFSGSHPNHDDNVDGNPTAMSSERRPVYDRLNDGIVEALGQFTKLRTMLESETDRGPYDASSDDRGAG